MNCPLCNKETLIIETFSFGEIRNCSNCNVLLNFLNGKYAGYLFQIHKNQFTYNFSYLAESNITIFYVSSNNSPSVKSLKFNKQILPKDAKNKLPIILAML